MQKYTAVVCSALSEQVQTQSSYIDHCLLSVFSWSHRTTGRIVWAQATGHSAVWVGSSMVRLWMGFPGLCFFLLCAYSTRFDSEDWIN